MRSSLLLRLSVCEHIYGKYGEIDFHEMLMIGGKWCNAQLFRSEGYGEPSGYRDTDLSNYFFYLLVFYFYYNERCVLFVLTRRLSTAEKAG